MTVFLYDEFKSGGSLHQVLVDEHRALSDTLKTRSDFKLLGKAKTVSRWPMIKIKDDFYLLDKEDYGHRVEGELWELASTYQLEMSKPLSHYYSLNSILVVSGGKIRTAYTGILARPYMTSTMIHSNFLRRS